MKDFFKTTLACVLGIVIAGVILLILGINVIAGIASLSDDKGDIEKNSVLFLDLNGTIEERTMENPLASIIDDDSNNYGLDEILAAIKEAKSNENIKGIYLQAGVIESASSATLEEIRGELNTQEDVIDSAYNVHPKLVALMYACERKEYSHIIEE